ncbi:hypothetical protein F7R91_25755 [Streptomyces luteolifulvus]|uniref:Uncharacterized protein n=1 Tax=Streptomyces luteolifulvus TaxID=2615112 RepID=A0A6H9UUM1_9ACTN|nr:hypothetical protein F7R91_25755 [Streptomyces luteolifulvus]
MSMPLTVDAQAHGLAGDGTTNDQLALARLVDVPGCPRSSHATRTAGRRRSRLRHLNSAGARTCGAKKPSPQVTCMLRIRRPDPKGPGRESQHIVPRRTAFPTTH